MMEAVVSAQAGAALLVEGVRYSSIHIDEPDAVVARRSQDFAHLFGGASDLIFLEDVELADVQRALDAACDGQTIVSLTLIVISEDRPDDLRREAAHELAELIDASPEATAYAERILFSIPAPAGTDVRGAIEFAELPAARDLLTRLNRMQPFIRRANHAWAAIPSGMFEPAGQEGRRLAEAILVREGVFRQFVLACAEEMSIDSAVLASLSIPQVRGLSNHRALIQQWSAGLKSKEQVRQPSGKSRKRQKSLDRGKELGRIERVKESIVHAIEVGDAARVRECVDELVRGQLENIAVMQARTRKLAPPKNRNRVFRFGGNCAQPLQLFPPGEAITHPGRTVSARFHAHSPIGSALSFSHIRGPLFLVDSSTGDVTWSPSWADVGGHGLTVRVTDADGNTADETWWVEVQDQQPVADSMSSMPAHPGRAVSYRFNAYDPEGDALEWEAVSTLPAGATFDPITGVFQWTPTWNDLGSRNIVVRVKHVDRPASATLASCVIEVSNQSPQFDPVSDSGMHFPGDEVVVRLTVSDPDGDDLTYTKVSGPGTVTKINNQSAEYRWTAETPGFYEVRVRVSDPEPQSDDVIFYVCVEERG
jgi:hypothetical protein